MIQETFNEPEKGASFTGNDNNLINEAYDLNEWSKFFRSNAGGRIGSEEKDSSEEQGDSFDFGKDDIYARCMIGGSSSKSQLSEIAPTRQEPEEDIVIDSIGDFLPEQNNRAYRSTPNEFKAVDASQIEGLRRTEVSQTEHNLLVEGVGRSIDSIVLIPDNYDPAKSYPLVVALHNYNADNQDFRELTDSESFREKGCIVVLPNAAGKDWTFPDEKGKGFGSTGNGVDDVENVARTIDAVKQLYNIDQDNETLYGFSQGGAMTMQLIEKLNTRGDGNNKVERAVVVAGAMMRFAEADKVKGTDIFEFEGGNDRMASKGAWIEPGTKTAAPVMDKLVADMFGVKAEPSRKGVLGDDVKWALYQDSDSNSAVMRISEKSAEHAIPGQPEKWNSRLTGSGDKSNLKMSKIVLSLIEAGKISRR